MNGLAPSSMLPEWSPDGQTIKGRRVRQAGYSVFPQGILQIIGSPRNAYKQVIWKGLTPLIEALLGNVSKYLDRRGF